MNRFIRLIIPALMLLGMVLMPLTGVLPAQAASSPPLPSGLIGAWAGNGNANDIINGMDGTLQNGATYASGQSGQAFSFDGNDSSVSIGNPSPLGQASTGMTVSAWINPQPPTSPSGAGWFFSDREPFVSEGFSVAVRTDGSITASIRTSTMDLYGESFQSPAGAVTFGQWQNVTVTANTTGDPVAAYVNGTAVPMTPFGSSINFGSSDNCCSPTLSGNLVHPGALSFGQREDNSTTEGTFGGAHYNGLMDDVRVFDRALSATEVQNNRTAAVVAPGPISYWPADGNAQDVISGNNGTLQGTTGYVPGILGQAFNFSSLGQGVIIGNSATAGTPADLQLNNSFTIGAWVKRADASMISTNESGGPGAPIFAAGGYGSYGFLLFDDGQLVLNDIGSTYVASNTLRVMDTAWHYIAVTKSGSSVTFYVDGASESAGSYDPGFVFNTGYSPSIGAPSYSFTTSNVFDGSIDELKIWGRALSGTEISNLYDGTVPPAALDGTQPGFPATQYPYASGAITVDPYPPTQGQPVTLGSLLQNPTSSAVNLTSVDFAISGYGLGLPWQPVGSVSNVTIPAAAIVNGTTVNGIVHPTIQWTPPFSGHHCVLVTLHYADGHVQTLQRNLDILGFSTGGPVTTNFQVGNPTAGSATVTLKLVPVSQSPSGWTATLDQTSVTLNAGQTYDASLTITPPSPTPSSGYATYNVEGYIGSTLIGGISKTVVIGSAMPTPTITAPTSWTGLSSTFLITGHSLPFAHIKCTHAGGGTIFETVADGSGNWSLWITLGSSGSDTLYITGELGGSVSQSIGGSGGIPVQIGGSVSGVGGLYITTGSGSSATTITNGGYTNHNVLTFGGAGTPGDTVKVQSSDPVTGLVTVVCTATVAADDSWSCTTGPQPDCDPTFSAYQVDASGDQGPVSSGIHIWIDTRPPTITITGVTNGGVYTNSATPVITIQDLNAKGGTGHVSGLASQSILLDGNPFISGTTITASGNHTLQVMATDNAGNQASTTLTFHIDYPPKVNAGGTYAAQEGTAAALSAASASDSDSDGLTYAWSVKTAPDTGATCTFSSATALNPTVTCNDDGTYTLQLAVNDSYGTVTDTATVTVGDTAPQVSISAPSYDQLIAVPTAGGTAPITITAPFTDAGMLDSHTCSVQIDPQNAPSWLAGSVTETAGTGKGTCSYSTNLGPGVYITTVHVQDSDGSVVGSASVEYVVYDPSSGFVTGGGWIIAPSGSCQYSSCLSSGNTGGRANFGFVSKYQKGATVPTGSTEFQFQDGSFEFHSNTYTALVISGNQAQYRGSGTVNGQNDSNGQPYKFILTARDGDMNGGTNPDGFRIKITDSSGNVVYDNLMNASDDMGNTQIIAGGDIKIHS